MIKYFISDVRPILKPKRGVIALWINQRGRPVEENTFLPLLKTTISEYFPNKYITGLDFRRIIPSLLYEDEDGNPIIPESEVDNFLTNYAGLVNTSKQILKNHYIRSVRINHHRKLLKKIDLQFLNTLESIRAKRAI